MKGLWSMIPWRKWKKVYDLAAGISAENILYSLLWLATVVAGNTAGAIILNAVSREEK